MLEIADLKENIAAAELELAGARNDDEIKYLNDLIHNLEQQKSILSYVELSAETNALDDPYNIASIALIWGLGGDFALLEESSQQIFSFATLKLGNIKKTRFDNILEAAEKLTKFVLVGEPGSGKTTTIRRLARDAAIRRLNNNSAPLPILLELPRWNNENSPIEFIRSYWPFNNDPAISLSSGDIVLYLDGLNEMGSDGPNKAEMLRKWLKAHVGSWVKREGWGEPQTFPTFFRSTQLIAPPTNQDDLYAGCSSEARNSLAKQSI